MTHSSRAHVWTADLEQALDYLEGLALILDQLADEGRGRDRDDDLLQRLENMDSQGGNWEPLRYQTGEGAGWRTVSDNVADLRRRLLEPYTEAAL
jgi:hypothetical protein